MKYLILIIAFSFSPFTFAKSIYSVSSLEMDSPSKEFKPLSKLVKEAKILGIGESSHGSQGFLKARKRLIKYFVKNENYRVILLEQGYRKTEKINDYLNSCQSDTQTEISLTHTLKSLEEIYSNEETKSLLEWLCEFNKYNSNPVSFHGIDQWEDPWINREIIKTGIEYTENKDYKKFFELAQKSCWAWQIDNWDDGPTLPSWDHILQTWRLQVKEHRDCIGSLYNLQRVMGTFQNKDPEKAFWINIALKVSYVYQQYRDLYITDIQRALNLRDDLQAYLTMTWVEKFGKKAILLAHNIHVSKLQSEVVPMNPGSQFKWVDVRSTGENLVGHYGREYKSIALTGYDVASSRDGQYTLTNKEDALDYYLSKKGNYLIVDPNARFLHKMSKWWMHNENEPMYLVPKKQYDAIFFIRDSREAIRLEF